jgi:hypothetical protein
MYIDIFKAIAGIIKPEFITNYSLNKEIEDLHTHITYLKEYNRSVEPFIDKLEDKSYEKHFGLTKAKYDFFYSHTDIRSHFIPIQLRTLSMFTQRDKNNKFVVSMNIMDKFLCLIMSLFGLVTLIVFGIILFKFKHFDVLDMSEWIKYKHIIFSLIVLPFFIVYIFIKFFVPLFHVPKFNKLYTKNK